MTDVSSDTKAVLLLTAPLIVRRKTVSNDLPGPLTLGEYNKLAELLHQWQHTPASLIAPEAEDLVQKCGTAFAPDRLRHLLGRGLLLAEVLAHWQERAIWVLSRADADYPARLKQVLGKYAPPLLYGCGDPRLLTCGGLAVVGSRNVDQTLLEYAQGVGELAALSGTAVVSGGAKGVDQAAVQGALAAGGLAVGVPASELEKTCLRREYRNALLERRLALISPYDPQAGFNVGNAMQRNKLIYALADAGLVVNADLKKGGTWNGAIEQLEKFRRIPLFVRSTGESFPAGDALRAKGAEPWPELRDAAGLRRVLEQGPQQEKADLRTTPLPQSLPLAQEHEESILTEQKITSVPNTQMDTQPHHDAISGQEVKSEAEIVWEVVKQAIIKILSSGAPMKVADVAARLKLEKMQTTTWLKRLVEAGDVKKQGKHYVLDRQLSLPN